MFPKEDTEGIGGVSERNAPEVLEGDGRGVGEVTLTTGALKAATVSIFLS